MEGPDMNEGGPPARLRPAMSPLVHPHAVPQPSWSTTPEPGHSDLDPEDWPETRRQAHRMLDDILDYVEDIRSRPTWQPMPPEARARLQEPLPVQGAPLAEIHAAFLRDVLPYATGNVHPGFLGWVHGGGTVAGLLGEMLAGGLNANLGGRDHAPIEVERQILAWVREIFRFPASASGLFVTGTSLANFLGVLVARRAALGNAVRAEGLGANGLRLRAYASRAVHSCVPRALDMAGLGSQALRQLPTAPGGGLDLEALRLALAEDRAAGFQPFLVVGTAGAVDTGAVDDLAAIADLCAREGLWFHVDGAFGALAILAPARAGLLRGIERADSLAFDFHKWGQVPYDAGYLLVRDGELHRAAFATPAAYLRRETRGMAAGSPWPTDLGPDLSRGFRALKTWFTLKAYGLERLGRAIEETCALATYLEGRIMATPELELLAPVPLNIVCFRHRGEDPDALNARIAVRVQESGLAAPSTTVLDGKLALRAAIVNHRTRREDLDRFLDAVLALAHD